MTPAVRVTVVGDAFLDVDVRCTTERLVPDTAAPVLDERDRRERPGGAALAALLAAAEPDTAVTLVAALGEDGPAWRISATLARAGVQVLALPTRATTCVKTRLLAAHGTVARLDTGAAVAAPLDVPAPAAAAIVDADAVLVADYGRGVAGHPAVRDVLRDRAPLVWDPHPRGGDPVPGATVVTPNAREAAAALGRPVAGSPARAGEHADALAARWRAGGVIVTLGARGAVYGTGSGAPSAVPAESADGDACGAGDAFAAALAVGLARHRPVDVALAGAVRSAGRFVARGGVAALDAPDLPPRPQHPPLADRIAAVRARGGTVVATGGCFDLLHAGHVATLAAARRMGDLLVVCLNSDASVRRLKGAGRPLQPEQDRRDVLAALACVDAVVLFDEPTPERVLAGLRPDIWVKGGDYAGAELPEAALVRGWGGRVLALPYLAGRSTTRLIDGARR